MRLRLQKASTSQLLATALGLKPENILPRRGPVSIPYMALQSLGFLVPHLKSGEVANYAFARRINNECLDLHGLCIARPVDTRTLESCG